MPSIIALISGLLFGVGLAVTQMVNPNKVLNFLDIAGNWDPSLLFVMGSAVIVYSLGYFLIAKRRQKPQFLIPTNRIIDKPLIIGAAIFGVGWGLAGICPGPAISNLLSGEIKIVAFVLAMVAGMGLFDLIKVDKK